MTFISNSVCVGCNISFINFKYSTFTFCILFCYFLSVYQVCLLYHIQYIDLAWFSFFKKKKTFIIYRFSPLPAPLKDVQEMLPFKYLNFCSQWKREKKCNWLFLLPLLLLLECNVCAKWCKRKCVGKKTEYVQGLRRVHLWLKPLTSSPLLFFENKLQITPWRVLSCTELFHHSLFSSSVCVISLKKRGLKWADVKDCMWVMGEKQMDKGERRLKYNHCFL